ncbi:MAG: CapA family protein [Clostridiaceae bacterium]|jgi:poly-gamma-glutamate synthesis protein (capsule biosynthesis protein)|nr:CapA family protein [Clostridiaceae bacterium]
MTPGKRTARKRGRTYSLAAPLLILAVVLVLLALQLAGNLPFGAAPAVTTASVQPSPAATSGTSAPTLAPTTAGPTATPTPEPVRSISLVAVGDVILHQSVIDGGLVASKPEPVYDYTPAFQYIRPIISGADLALANYEGTLAGPPYGGYPFFCAPDAIADALLDTGFDVAWTANNHTIDKGLQGVIRTASVFRDTGLTVVGTRPDETSRSDCVLDVSGFKIGLLAYTYETIGTPTRKALNGIPMPAGADPLIDSFNPDRPEAFERDLAALLERAAALRREGAELICLSLHWGQEYQTRSSRSQRDLAQRLADEGIELIIGHHPHVLQEIDVLQSADGIGQTLVFYSISNILHNMEYTTHNTKGYAQDAIVARIRLERTDGRVSVAAAEYVPTYVSRVAKGSGLQHLIVPVLEAIGDPKAYQSVPAELEASLARIRSVLADSQGTETIPISEKAH